MAEKYFNLMKNRDFVIELSDQPVRERIDFLLGLIPEAFAMIKESQGEYKNIRNSIYLDRKMKNPSK